MVGQWGPCMALPRLQFDDEVEEEEENTEEEERSGDGSTDDRKSKRESIEKTQLELSPHFSVENDSDDSLAQVGTQTRNLSCYSGVDEPVSLRSVSRMHSY